MQKANDQPARILIVSSNRMVCAGIRMILEIQSDIFVIGEVASVRIAIEVAARDQPHVVLIDLDRNGVGVLRLIRDLQKVADRSLPLISLWFRGSQSRGGMFRGGGSRLKGSASDCVDRSH
jgi:DNA-binding NarL/FixJ family response regulator